MINSCILYPFCPHCVLHYHIFSSQVHEQGFGGESAELKGDSVYLRGLVGDPDGQQVLRDEIEGPANDAEALGTELAERLLKKGAGDILSAVYDSNAEK